MKRYDYIVIRSSKLTDEQLQSELDKAGTRGYRFVAHTFGRIILEREVES